MAEPTRKKATRPAGRTADGRSLKNASVMGPNGRGPSISPTPTSPNSVVRTATGSGGPPTSTGGRAVATAPGSPAGGTSAGRQVATRQIPLNLSATPSAASRGMSALSRVAGPLGVAGMVAQPQNYNNEEADLDRMFPRGEDGIRRAAPEAAEPSAELPPTVVTGRRPAAPQAAPSRRPMARSESDSMADMLNGRELERIGRVNAGKEEDRKPEVYAARGGMMAKSGPVPSMKTKVAAPKSSFPDFTKGSPVKAASPMKSPPKAKSPATKTTSKMPAPPAFKRGGSVKKKGSK